MRKLNVLLISTKRSSSETLLYSTGRIKQLDRVQNGVDTLRIFIRYYKGERSTPDVVLLEPELFDECISIVQMFQEYACLKRLVVLIFRETPENVDDVRYPGAIVPPHLVAKRVTQNEIVHVLQNL